MTRIRATDPTVKFSIGDWLKILGSCFVFIVTMAVPAAVYMGVIQNKVDRNEKDIASVERKHDDSVKELSDRLTSVEKTMNSQNQEILNGLGEIKQALGEVQGQLKRMKE